VSRAVSDYDLRVIRAVGDGAGTWMVAARMDVPTSDIRHRLKRLEREGLVHRSPRSSVNNIIWIAGSAHP
jgi:Mn-dependent DtxR family transcriptional regulator